ncbi:MAG TPA: ABC transporter substrate-binding protein [Candidatus Angelobacter sp.]|nr:ABC transporter substrate-binding protein [Candidatus Angelobacter sp.]
MRSIELQQLAAASLVLVAAQFFSQLSAKGAIHPKRGGTLRVELLANAVTLDPREWKAGSAEFAANEKLAALVFDRLVMLDNYGRFRPQLAAEWSHDAAFKRWQFMLRANVKFSDGSALTAGDVAAALQPLLPGSRQISAAGNSVVIQSSEAMPDLLEELASGRFFIYRVQLDGSLLGTGPFFQADSPAGNSKVETQAAPRSKSSNVAALAAGRLAPLHFRENEGTWSGRPFVDGIEVTLGVPPLRQLFDLQVGKADLVEIAPDLVRRAMQENQRVWASSPVTLYGLAFDDAQPAASDARLREAISLSLDRHTMANVLLQKQAEPAAALLPQWLSGYAFLFTMETNLERAKEISATLPASGPVGPEALRLRVDPSGDLAKLLGERIAVNARQAAIPVQVLNRGPLRNVRASTNDPAAGLHLFAWHYSSLSPRVELETFVSSLNLGALSENGNSAANLEHLYERERKLLDERRVLPLVALPEYVGLGRNVHDWMPARWGEWHLADVWLDLPESGADAGHADSSALPTIRMGAKP